MHALPHGSGVRCFCMVSGRSAWQTPRATVRATHGARSRPDQGEKRLFELEDAIDQLSDRPVIRVVYPQFDQLVAQSHGKVGHASQVEALELIEHCVEMAQAIADVIAEVSAGAPPHSPQGSAGPTRYRACDSELLDKDLHTVPLARARRSGCLKARKTVRPLRDWSAGVV